MSRKDSSPPAIRQGLSVKQLELRRGVLGGTDAAAIFGLSRRNAFDVYAEKVGEAPPQGEMGEDALWGLLLEPVLRDVYQSRTGVSVTKPGRLTRNREKRWLAGHLDGRGKDRIFEAKVRRSEAGWGEAGSDEIPPAVKTQVVHYMAVTGAPRADVAVLFRGSRMEIYTIWRDGDLIRDMVGEEEEWWTQHVMRRIPPDWDGSTAATRYLRRRYPNDDGSELVALPHQYGILNDLAAARRRTAFYKQQEELLKQVIGEAMGPARRLVAPGMTITRVRSSDYHKVDWQRYAESLEGLLEQVSLGQLPVTMDPLEQRETLKGLYTSAVEGTRQFRVAIHEPRLEGGTR